MSYANYDDMDQQLDIANYNDMDQRLETANPPASWQSYAPSVQHGGYAEFG